MTDPLELDKLFEGGGEPWLPLLKPTIEAQAEAAAFIGPSREKTIVPVRELTFQALKPNPPERWKVVVFGQNPYPRVESATGIAMFDNTFSEWRDPKFGKVMSIRCIIKAATMWKYGIPKATKTADIRTLLADKETVQPPEWFQSMLTQGVLLLNAALTASSDGSRSTSQHTKFWRPVVQKLVEEILRAKQATEDSQHRGVVFGWWGTHAKALRKIVEKLQKQYPDVPVTHIDHPNPAATGDIFCDGNHFGAVNDALKALGMAEIDWLPSVGWRGAQQEDETAERMGQFINTTMELHKLYLERLAGVKDEKLEELAAISLAETPLVKFGKAIGPVLEVMPTLRAYAKRSWQFGKEHKNGLNAHQIAALHLYTLESRFYRKLNSVLRNPDRTRAQPFLPYLRLFLSAMGALEEFHGSLWRGVALDLRAQYPKGRRITWWGVSSCTSKREVAENFMGGAGQRMLFEIKPVAAVSIQSFSNFTGEAEYVLAPGTQLEVRDVHHQPSGLTEVELHELAGEHLVG